MTASPNGAVLGRQALNRALLERQLLLRRSDLSVPDTLQHLVGMQAQVPRSPYVGLWARLRTFAPDDLAGLISTRQAVRIALMRSTIHLVTARDCLALRPVVQPVLDRGLYTGSAIGRALVGVDTAALARVAREAVEAAPRTLTEWTCPTVPCPTRRRRHHRACCRRVEGRPRSRPGNPGHRDVRRAD